MKKILDIPYLCKSLAASFKSFSKVGYDPVIAFSNHIRSELKIRTDSRSGIRFYLDATFPQIKGTQFDDIGISLANMVKFFDSRVKEIEFNKLSSIISLKIGRGYNSFPTSKLSDNYDSYPIGEILYTVQIPIKKLTDSLKNIIGSVHSSFVVMEFENDIYRLYAVPKILSAQRTFFLYETKLSSCTNTKMQFVIEEIGLFQFLIDMLNVSNVDVAQFSFGEFLSVKTETMSIMIPLTNSQIDQVEKVSKLYDVISKHSSDTNLIASITPKNINDFCKSVCDMDLVIKGGSYRDFNLNIKDKTVYSTGFSDELIVREIDSDVITKDPNLKTVSMSIEISDYLQFLDGNINIYSLSGSNWINFQSKEVKIYSTCFVEK